jgi:tetratricopeptide (TPR) repeat protein
MENRKHKQPFLKSRTRAQRKNKEYVKKHDEARTPPLVENENEPPSRQSTPSKARKPMSSVLSSIETISFQTPLRKNTSTKFMANSDTANLILKDICTNDTCHTHVIHGEPGIGKTWLMHQIAQLPLSKLHFTDGIVWIGISKCDSLRYSELIEIYHKIFEDIFRDKRKVNYEDPELDFSSILYMESKTNITTVEDKSDEKRAMLQARDIMSNLLGIKSCLVCIDGLQDRIDSQYFNFTTNRISSKSKSLVTYNGPTIPSSHIKIWTLSGMNNIDAKKMFFEKLSVKSTSHPNFQSKFSDMHLLSRGNPCILDALSCLINDKVGNDSTEKYLNEFSTKFSNAPCDAQVQLAIITEAFFSHSSLGEKNSTIAFRCFAAFAVVFTRDECTRPFVPRAPVRVLFKGILDRADRSQIEDNDSRVDNIIEFLVNMKILTQADGFDDHGTPRLFYQVSCDMHQEYAMSLNRECSSLNKILIEKCQSSFIERKYSSRCKEIDHYMLNYLPYHCMKANQFEEIASILQDVRFIEDRMDHLGFIKACNNHIEDTEKLLISSRDANKKLDSKQIFAESYEHFVRSLEAKAMDQTCDKESIVWCIWKLSFSLLQNHLIHKACDIIQRGMELQSELDQKIIDLDENLLKRVSDGKYDGSDNSGRALILFGTSLLQCSSMKIESYYLLKNGLNCLQTTLGDSNLEFARAQVYVGEIMYKDFKLYRKSLSLFQNALYIFNTRLGEESEEVTDLILLIGKSCLHAGELDTSLNIFRKIGPRLKGVLALDIEIKVGYIYIVKNEFDRALQVLSRAKKRTNDADVLERIDKLMLQCGENDRCSV